MEDPRDVMEKLRNALAQAKGVGEPQIGFVVGKDTFKHIAELANLGGESVPLYDIVKRNPSPKARTAFLRAMEMACKEQDKLIKESKKGK